MFQIRLRELRESRSLSQKDLAQALGISQSTVAMWENGSNFPRKSTLFMIASFFKVSVDYLMGLSYDDGTGIKKENPAESVGTLSAKSELIRLINSQTECGMCILLLIFKKRRNTIFLKIMFSAVLSFILIFHIFVLFLIISCYF